MRTPVNRLSPRLGLAFTAALFPIASARPARAQAPPVGFEGLARPARFRLVLNGTVGLAQPSYGDMRTLPEYAEETTIRSSYQAGTGYGAEGALQVSLFQGVGILVGYSHLTRDVTGTVDVTRPHPLYLNQPRQASAGFSGYGLTQGALDLDLAFAHTAGHLDWALFAGATLFHVQADLVGTPTYDERYPYDELQIASVPKTAVKDSPTGFNVGGRLDWRFGSSRRFGAGVEIRYSKASAALKATPDATPSTFDAGGLTVGAGLRLYF